ncbi:MAG: dihydropteroate synthase [Muribaculum sp.]|nr:dihydropteroate synthase [Muribaculum sp.]
MKAEELWIGGKPFGRQGRTYIMGILNVTPDSFSDGGQWNRMDRALYHVEEMQRDGADIVDIGGESTRPGYEQISVQEEIERVMPVLEAIKSRFDIPVSLDTYKSGVARAGIAAGADLINDIWGLRYDADMAEVIAESGLPCCLMHNRRDPEYRDFWQEMALDLTQTLSLAEQAGIARDKIILDPGVGFGKSYEQNLSILGNLERLQIFGCPVLLGCSRKSVIGLTLNLPADERLEGTLATTVFGVIKGCMFVRVHDVKENVRAARMAEAVCQAIC